MIDNNDIPRHIAIIMDGNGRWAKEKGFMRTAGHHKGINRVREIIKEAGALGVSLLTFFAFSTENWCRPKQEVNMLMRALDNFLGRYAKELIKNNIRLEVIGREEPLPKYVLHRINEVKELTKDNSGLIIVLAFNYGSRQEITDAAKRLCKDALSAKVSIRDIDENLFGNYLYTKGLPDPDLLIRTSGELRISNFLMWQISYSELYFCNKYWPDFDRLEFRKAIIAYQKRQRRFGGIDAKK